MQGRQGFLNLLKMRSDVRINGQMSTKPRNDLSGSSKYTVHDFDLAASLCHIRLVDTERINVDPLGLPFF